MATATALLCRFLLLLLQLAWAHGECAPMCTKYGTCNEELQRCDCPVGRTGEDCSLQSMPACELILGFITPCVQVPTTCACLKECFAAWGGQGAVPGGMRSCYHWHARPDQNMSSPADLAAIYEGPQKYAFLDGPVNTHRFENINQDHREWLRAVPLDQCPDACNLHGWCNQHGRCSCFPGWQGIACNTFKSQACFNNCNDRGTCVNGFCHCEPGVWGVDCSISRAEPGGPAHNVVLWGGTKEAARRPSVYIYDLPPIFDTWYLGYRAPDRFLEAQIHERLLASEYRTPNAESADFFYVPFGARRVGHFQNTQPKFIATYEYIKETWPWWNRAEGRDHLQVLVGDYGPADNFGYHGHPGKVVPPLKNVILLTHNGDTARGMFRMGHDVVLPPVQSGVSGFEPKFSPLFGLRHSRAHIHDTRDTLFFFAGGIEPRTVRGEVHKLHSHRQGYLISDHSIPDYKQQMARSIFCLAPPGKDNNGWGRRMTLGALYGCIPVIIQDGWRQPLEELLPYDEFSVRIAEKDIKDMHLILDKFTPQKIGRMQRALACVAHRFLYSTIFGNYGSRYEDGAEDALESVLEMLRRRMKIHNQKVLDFGIHGEVPPARVEEMMKEIRLPGYTICHAEHDNIDRDEPRMCTNDTAAMLCAYDCKAAQRHSKLFWPPGGAVCVGQDTRPCRVTRKCYHPGHEVVAEAEAEAKDEAKNQLTAKPNENDGSLEETRRNVEAAQEEVETPHRVFRLREPQKASAAEMPHHTVEKQQKVSAAETSPRPPRKAGATDGLEWMD